MVRTAIILLLSCLTCFADGVFGPAQGGVFGARRAAPSAPSGPVPYARWKMIGTDTNATSLLNAQGSYAAMDNKPNVATGPTFYTNSGYYYQFDNSEDHFITTNDIAFSSTQKTITAWISINTSASTVEPIFSKYDPSGSKSEYMLYAYEGTIVGLVENANETKYIRANSAALPQLTWVHVAMTWNGGTNVYTYTNGVFATVTAPITGGFTPSDYTPSTTAPMIGRAATFYYGAAIQDVRYYTQTLTSAQITNVYLEGRPTP